MEDKELKITVDRVREAAKSCPQAKAVLTRLFPEVFPPTGFKAGTIFRPKNQKPMFNPEFLILAHMAESRVYALIDIRTGFQWGQTPVDRWLFKRPAGSGKLIEFPEEIVKQLDVIAEPSDDYQVIFDNRSRRQAT